MAGRKKHDGPVNYFELPRKQLQTLCKRYGFPANRTNLLMAEFLSSHLNSDEYLNRDKSLPSPAVKTRFQCGDEEATPDNKLSTIPESQPAIVKTKGRRLSHDFVDTDTAQEDCTLEASKAAETGLGQINQIRPEDVVAAGPSVEEALDSTTSGFRIQNACLQSQTESVEYTSLPPSTTEEANDITNNGEREGHSRPSSTRSGSGDLSSTVEEAADSGSIGFGYRDSSMESQESQGTPLPLSVMPYVRPATPDLSSSSGTGVKLFVDSKNGGFSAAEKLRDYYQAWGAPLPTNVTKTQEECVLSPLKALEKSEKSLPPFENSAFDAVSKADRAAEDQEGTKNSLSQAAVVSTNCYKTDARPMKSCLSTPTRKSSPFRVSFLSSANDMVLDTERSEIVKEWSYEQRHEDIQPNDVISCSDEDEALTGELVLSTLDENLLRKQSAELNTRTLQSPADLDSPPVGIVTEAVKIFEEQHSQSRGPSSLQRKDSYKGSPFLKSSRVAAELERASKLGQTRRIGILALKRAMGVVPVFSDTRRDVENAPEDGASSSPPEGIVLDSQQDGEKAPQDGASSSPGEEIVVSMTNTSSTLAGERNSPKVEDGKFKEGACEAVIGGQMGSDTNEYVTTESQRASEDSSKSQEKAAEKPRVALNFLDIDFTKLTVPNAVRGPPARMELEIDYAKVRQLITADKTTALSPLDGDRLTVNALDSSPNPTTPTKSLDILDVLSEGEEKDTANGFSLCGKENEWLGRQEQHKTPLTGRSKEKSLRVAEKRASSLREELLKKRRGMMMEAQLDASDSPGIESSPLKQLATNRML